jgi:hypothetical protein
MDNYFRGIKEKPYHLSVGAVLANDTGQICCHFFKAFKSEADLIEYKNFYILMRETVERNESLEESLQRGICEEFGARGKIITYLGSLKSKFNRLDFQIEKTTLYFLLKLEKQDIKLRLKDEEEKASEIQWHSADFLIEKMKEQGKRYLDRTDLDESLILERAKIAANRF